MFPKEIVEILQRYQDDNKKELLTINEDIQDIILQLKHLCTSLSHNIQKLIDTGIVDSKEDELFQDTKILRNFINSIELLNINSNDFVNTEETSDELSPIIFDKKVYPYLVSDDICPFCNYKMSHHLVHYQRISNSELRNENVMWNRCSACKRLFVLDCDAEEFDFNGTNIALNKDYYYKIPEIDIHTVIVLDNTLQCSSQHQTKDFLAQLPGVDQEGNLSYYTVSASYCFTCNKFTILKNEFNKIKDIVICKVIDKTYDNKKDVSQNNFDIEQEESVLTYYGYNVQTKKNISEQQRQIILSSLIESKIMSRREVIDHINTLIKRGSKIPSWINATQKWKDDIDFVNSYKKQDLPKIVFDNIILQYKKTQQM